MRLTSGIRLRRASLALFLVFCGEAVSQPCLLAAQPQVGTEPEPARAVAPAQENPQPLTQQACITVHTHVAPELAAASAAIPKTSSFEWRSSWAGWDGLHLGLSRKTQLADPWAEVRARVAGTNASPVFHLEELKMSGKVGAKFALDGAAFVTGNEFRGFDAGVELRRARLYAKGDCLLVLPVSYQLEVGYIPNQFYIEESYLSFRDIPLIGELRAGQYQAPMGLDVITSSRDIPFMEPAAALQALAPGVNAGLQIGRPVLDGRATWRHGLFADVSGRSPEGHLSVFETRIEVDF
ncbi:MAG TPA: porin [Verrucomicrobiota bacterium]|nr:porin [Verrucomicrobiota bacterium]